MPRSRPAVEADPPGKTVTRAAVSWERQTTALQVGSPGATDAPGQNWQELFRSGSHQWPGACASDHITLAEGIVAATGPQPLGRVIR
jgi:hypothetical protein